MGDSGRRTVGRRGEALDLTRNILAYCYSYSLAMALITYSHKLNTMRYYNRGSLWFVHMLSHCADK